MFKRPPSRPVAHRGTHGLSTVSTAIAVLAIAGLALGACSAPAAGVAVPQPESAAFPQSFDSWDSLRKEHRRSVAAVNPATPATSSDDSWDSLRKEHMRASR
jgi:hypothetical protein